MDRRTQRWRGLPIRVVRRAMWGGLTVASLLTGIASDARSQGFPWEKGFASITAKELQHHVQVLAHDSMRGRDTPSPELDKAAAYIAAQFQRAGLRPLNDSMGYYQRFAVCKTYLSEPNTLRFRTPVGEWSCRLKDDFVPLPLSSSGVVEGQVVFAGYGITAPEYGYDDYQGVDAVGKIVLVFTHEPRERDSTEVFQGRQATDHSNPLVKVLNAIDHGAIGLILVNDPLHHVSRKPPNLWPSLMRRTPGEIAPLQLRESEEQLVAVQIGRSVLDSLFHMLGKDPVDVQRTIDSTLQPLSFPLPVTAHIEVGLRQELTWVKNVVGYLPGSDPVLRNQVIVVGAHYDHVGTVHDTVIYNGSDDNASGTAGIIELAEAFGQNGYAPLRSILFIAFAGEEKGFFGSRYYTANPLLPIDSTIAMINLDMISRNDTNQVGVAGSSVSPELFAMVEEANRFVDMEITRSADNYFRQSDHYPFYRKRVPVLFFNTLDHPDLHKPTDDPEKAIPEKMERVVRLVYLTVWNVAISRQRPSWHEFAPSRIQATSEARPEAESASGP
ncbi:MAG: M20/M25/M40 family metallo-hydrolase [candidate division KSB1 bacterium]|nr:M20/M25/M40 family metallo-hydrolase [candidate division KSB1 bacterium]